MLYTEVLSFEIVAMKSGNGLDYLKKTGIHTWGHTVRLPF